MHTDFVAHPDSCKMGAGSLYRGYSGQGLALSAHTPLAPRLKKRYSYASSSPLCLFAMQKDSLTFMHHASYI